MNPEKPILISEAATKVGESKETLIQWISSGRLKMYHPNYVLLSDVRRAKMRVKNTTNYKMFDTNEGNKVFQLLDSE